MTFNMQSSGASQGPCCVLSFIWYSDVQCISCLSISPSLHYSAMSICVSVRYGIVSAHDRTTVPKLWALWKLEIISPPMERGCLLYESLPHWKLGRLTCYCHWERMEISDLLRLHRTIVKANCLFFVPERGGRKKWSKVCKTKKIMCS